MYADIFLKHRYRTKYVSSHTQQENDSLMVFFVIVDSPLIPTKTCVHIILVDQIVW